MFCFSKWHPIFRVLATGSGAEAFLGTQGYVWDTQSDMAFTLLGATSSLILFRKYHNTLIFSKEVFP